MTRRSGLSPALLIMFLIILLVMQLVIPSGCAFNQNNGFPTLPSNTETSSGSPTATTAGGSSIESVDGQTTTAATTEPPIETITVAGPWNAETLNNLRLLYSGMKSGQLHQTEGQMIINDISLDNLKQFEGPLRVELIPVTIDEGATYAMIKLWQAAKSLPDLIYLSQTDSLVDKKDLLDLTGYVSDDKRLAANNVYPALLSANLHQGRLLGLPYLVTVPVIFYNQQVFDKYKVSYPAITWTWSEYVAICASLQKGFRKDGSSLTPQELSQLANQPAILNSRLKAARFALENPQELLKYLPAGLNAQTGYAQWDGTRFQFNQPAFRSTVTTLRSFVKTGYSPLHLNPQQKPTAWNGADPQADGRVAMWVADSSQLSAWLAQSKISINFSLLPTLLDPADTDNRFSCTPWLSAHGRPTLN
jgi:hypothetical protein